MTCRPIPVPPGPEDIAIDAATGVAYVASTDRWAVEDAGESPAGLGAISRLDLRQEVPVAQDVTPASLRAGPFQPHGISLYRDEADTRLFVVDHGADTGEGASPHAIQVFTVTADGLRQHLTIRSEALVSPNDVAAVSPAAFYVTNDHGEGFARAVRDVIGLNEGHLLYFDGARFHRVGPDIPYANGVAVDPQTQRLFVSSSITGELLVFGGTEGHPLTRLDERLPLGAPLDNIDLPAGERALYVAGHPEGLRFLAYAERLFWTRHSPSLVYRVPLHGDTLGPATEIFRSDGEDLSAASVAALYHWAERGIDRLLLGAIFADHILLCDRKRPA